MNDHDCPAHSCVTKQPSFYLNDISNDISSNNDAEYHGWILRGVYQTPTKPSTPLLPNNLADDKTNVFGRNSETTENPWYYKMR